MRQPRLLIILLVLLLLGGPVLASPPLVGAVGGELSIVPLPGGRVLIVGLGRAEVYDPATEATVETGRPTGPVGYGHTLTPLPNGQVLLAGGISGARGDRPSARAEIYSWATGYWQGTIPMPVARSGHAAVALADGRVLLAGGTSDGATAIFVPSPGSWRVVGKMATAHQDDLVLTLLRDGRVLATGGPTVERYDPATEQWTTVAPLRQTRTKHTATLLPDGRVLVVGGVGEGPYLAAVEIYDPATDQWTAAPALNTARAFHTATPLADGRVLVVGGAGTSPSATATAEIYDPAAERWILAAPQTSSHAGHAALLLPTGRVLLVGGNGNTGRTEQYTLTPPERCFAETGRCINGAFLAYWEAHGGLAINGFPLAAPTFETLEDGNPYYVQYCERTRLELHPEVNTVAAAAVLLGQFGRRIHPAEPPIAPPDGARYFPETGHTLRGQFGDYWEANGGLAQFGYPLTEEFREAGLGNGAVYTVQYFERARFESHPENAAPYDVLLGQFGWQILAENERLTGSFLSLYIQNGAVRARLGAPNVPQIQLPGATQAFERGRMLYLGATTNPVAERIYVLCGDPQAGVLVTDGGRRPDFPNTWAEGQDPGGGPAPIPGLFLPQRGFGKVWRDNPPVRECVGYARTATETAATLTVQQFEHGLLIGVDLPEGRVIYVIGAAEYQETPARGTYERYADPVR